MAPSASDDDRAPVHLRGVRDDDLPDLFEHQRDPVAVEMVGLPSRDRAAFDAHWARIRRDDAVVVRTVLVGDRVAGSVLSFERDGRRLVGYWLDRAFWGRGIATRALAVLLDEIPHRPLHACVSPSNAGSIRVLEKCGFTQCPERDADDALLYVLR